MPTSDRVRHLNNASITYRWKMIAASLAAMAMASSMPAYGFLARPVIFAALGAVTKPPSGWLQFCSDERPGEMDQ
jgi:hypothetical protein